MRKMFTIAGLSLLKSRREKVFLVVMTAMTIFVCFIVALAYGDSTKEGPRVRVALADCDESNLSQEIIAALEASGAYKVTLYSNAEQVRSEVRDGREEVAFIIPEGFEAKLLDESPLTIKVISLTTSASAPAASKVVEKTLTRHLLSGAVSDIMRSYAVELGVEPDVDAVVAAAVARLEAQPVLEVDVRPVGEAPQLNSNAEGFGQTAMGMMIQFTMFTVIFSAGEILEERKNKTWGRLLSTPTHRYSILGGKLLGAYLVGVVQIAILILAGSYLFGINFGSNIPGVIVLFGVFLLAVTGLGLFLSTIVRTMSQLQAASPMLIVATCMLGGCFWPLELVPPVMRTIARITPQAWVMDGLRNVVLRGNPLSTAVGPILVLLGFTALFFGLGVSRVKFE